ncbi:hypothetical protein Patl1_11804 [Pistacia atlantica]|uniref:Uncharacterized protein n=1 Tax=Pistacia atlantica TaxID=434234 RepID=A0ACC1A3K0_9ROSI|nr:hypothetical protein Patl1_11804 [Pistacia atlantica]
MPLSSLHQLLVEEGFEPEKLSKNSRPIMKLKERVAPPDDSITLPIYICRNVRTFDYTKAKTEKSKGSSIVSSARNSNTNKKRSAEAAPIDEVAIRAVVSILSGFIGRYLKDESFRKSVKQKINNVLVRRRKDCEDGAVLTNMEIGIESIEILVEDEGATKKELRMELVKNSIQLLSIVASLNSKNSRQNSTCGIPNSHLSAFAQLYMAIIYKLEKNDRICARHLLQVFVDSPFLVRTHLLPDLWEHVFLPHLLHLQVWYNKEFELISNLNCSDKEKRMKGLSKVYNEQMDMGTTKFALYYKQWLKVGANAPTVPSVPLPSRPSYGGTSSRRRRSSDSLASQSSSTNKNLYQTVFGPTPEQISVEFNHQRRHSINAWNLQEENYNNFNYVNVNKESRTRRRSYQYDRVSRTNSWIDSEKSDYFRVLTCRGTPKEFLVNSTRNESNVQTYSSELSSAITAICSSENLTECEVAIRVVARAWLNSHGDPAAEAELLKAPVIEAMLEVLFASSDDEILELAVSILAEFVARNEANRQIILNSDPQLEIFIRLLRSSSLFLKAAVLLYLLEPKAKQMISTEWVPLVLRVLEFGDQLQTLFTVCCRAQVAAFYFLDQLLNGFDEDKNLENAREVVSLGGLGLLMERIEKGEIDERKKAVSIVICCIKADENCRNFLAENLNKASILELIAGDQNLKNSDGSAIALLTELLSLQRRTQMMKFLDGLSGGWGGFNTMHILLVYLQRAPPEERPLVAAILLQLDLLGDPLKCSMYREEAMETIIAAMDCQTCDEKVQEQTAKALMMLGGYVSEATPENWLLKQGGLHEKDDSFYSKRVVAFDETMNEEEQATEIWQKVAAIALVKSSNKSLFSALSNCIGNGIPSLARASLFTVAWLSRFLHSLGDENLLSMACSILAPQLLQSSSYDRAHEEQALASFSLECLTKSSDYFSMLSSLEKDFSGPLWNPY